MPQLENIETIDNNLVQSAMNYEEYTQLLEELFAKGKTTGENQSEDLLNYAKMNLQRMKRLAKTVELNKELKSYIESNTFSKITFLVLTEGWCGDAAQCLPLINKIAEYSEEFDLKLILRDKNLELMDQFLTNGGRSIPKLIALNENSEVLGTWGPRPKEAQDVVDEFKSNNKDAPYSELATNLQLWYARNKTQAQQTEFLSCLKSWTGQDNK